MQFYHLGANGLKTFFSVDYDSWHHMFLQRQNFSQKYKNFHFFNPILAKNALSDLPEILQLTTTLNTERFLKINFLQNLPFFKITKILDFWGNFIILTQNPVSNFLQILKLKPLNTERFNKTKMFRKNP